MKTATAITNDTTCVISKDEATPLTPKVAPLKADRLGLAGVLSNVWTAHVPNGTEENILNGEFWRQQALKFSVGDEIVVKNDALTFYSRLLVVGANPTIGSVAVTELFRKELEPYTPPRRDTATCEPRYGGLHLKWQLVRKADGVVLVSGLKSEADAIHTAATQFAAKAEGPFQS